MDAPAFAAIRFVRAALRSIAFCLLAVAMSLMTMVKPVHASGTVASTAPMWCANEYDPASCIYPTKEDACRAAIGNRSDYYYGFVYYFPGGEMVGYACYGYATSQPGNGYWAQRFGWLTTKASCPLNSQPTGTTTCTCNDPYVPDSTGTSCVPVPVVTCAAPSVPDGAGGCACNPPNRINSIGECTACPVDPLPKPLFNDACAEVLENIHSTRAQKDAACGVLTPKLKDGMACFADKLSRTNDIVTSNPIPLKITSDIRDIAYQAHFREIWDKMELLVALESDPIKKNACVARRAEVAAEKGCDNAGSCERKSCAAATANGQRSHCLKHRPALPNPNDAQHTQGIAFDVSEDDTVVPLQDAVDALNPPQNIQQFLDAPTNCGLIWGGTFKTNKDPVHFLAR